MLDPSGPAARRVAGLWWLLLAISAVVLLVILILLGMSWRKGRLSEDDTIDRSEVTWGERFIVVAGVVIPSIILVAVFLVSLRDMDALSAPDGDPALTIEVVARDWWWEVRYPQAGAVTANEIHIPSGQPVRVLLTTGDVIHSFWVPRLQVKKDAVTGDRNELWLEADTPGRYRGQCAEFCGLQHANMVFWVEADPPDEFEEWLALEARPVGETDVPDGEQIFLSSTCAGCHAIRGTPADSQVGPDLTHVAQRETIAAGILANTRSNMARWILDPHSIKPGVTMPPTELSAEELTALLDYLESLD